MASTKGDSVSEPAAHSVFELPGAPTPTTKGIAMEGASVMPSSTTSMPSNNGKNDTREHKSYTGEQSNSSSALPIDRNHVEYTRTPENVVVPIAQKWSDLVFATLFIAQILVFVALSIISLRALGTSERDGGIGHSGGTSMVVDASTAYILALSSLLGFIIAVILMFLFKFFPTIMLEGSLGLAVVLSVAWAVYSWVVRYWSAAILFTLGTIIAMFWYRPLQRRIPLSRHLILFVNDASSMKTIWLGLGATVLQTIYSIYWSFTVVSIYQGWHPHAPGSTISGGHPSRGAVIGLVVFSVLSFYWTSQFLVNLMIFIESGTFSFLPRSPLAEPIPVKKSVSSNIRRALTHTLGSIAIGSLLVAPVDIIRAAVQEMKPDRNKTRRIKFIGRMIRGFVKCVAGIQSLGRFFNRFAFVEMASTRKPHFVASRDTYKIIRDCQLDEIYADCLVTTMWIFLSGITGGTCSGLILIYLKQSDPTYVSSDPNIRAFIMGMAFLSSFFTCSLLGYALLTSGILKLFLTLSAAGRESLAESGPRLLELIQREYPFGTKQETV